MTRHEAGFSLIESLVALALGAMVVSAVLSTVRVAAAGAKRAAATTSDAESFARAGTVLAGDADHAIWLPGAFLGLAVAVDLPQTPRPVDGMPQAPVVVQYRLAAERAGVTLTRAEGQEPAVALWHSDRAAEFRFLAPDGTWVPEWTGPGLPHAFAVTDPRADSPLLIAALPDLLPAICARGPGPDCPLAAEDFP